MNKKTFHIIGICGIGMSAIAQILKNSGFNVQGSDNTFSYIKNLLEEKGITVLKGHSAKNINSADVIIKSTAISDKNVEIVEAKKQNKKILQRFEILCEILNNKNVIAISGCHGKTTTTAMIGEIFAHAGLEPTIICGGIMQRFKNNVKLGSSNIFIVEADESDDTFNKIYKSFVVVTNAKADHLDFHQTEENVHKKFTEFIGSAAAVIPLDARNLISQNQKFTFYDFDQEKEQEKILRITGRGWQTKFWYIINGVQHDFTLNLPGQHNVENAAAAISCALYHGISIDIIKKSLTNFYGVKRRLSYIGDFLQNKVIDDYAHHPDEISATLKTLSAITKDVIAVIQPHRYTRVKSFFNHYIKSFAHAKVVILLDVFSAGEEENGFTSERLYKVAAKNGTTNVIFVKSYSQLKNKIIEINQKNGLIVFMGAGDITDLAHNFVGGSTHK